MFEQDKESFGKLVQDLCVSVNRPFSADLVRVLWEDLQYVPFPQIERQAKQLRISGKKTFNSNDLRPPPEERAALGGPDNNQILSKLDRAFTRLWARLSERQRSLAQYHEYVWTKDKLAPRPVALIIRPDREEFADRVIEYPGHRITVLDAEMLDDDMPSQNRPQMREREPGSDDDFDEAARATALLNRVGTPDLLQP